MVTAKRVVQIKQIKLPIFSVFHPGAGRLCSFLNRRRASERRTSTAAVAIAKGRVRVEVETCTVDGALMRLMTDCERVWVER